MQPFSLVVRRTHLYIALFSLPWFLMYGVSSLAFSHPEWFERPVNEYNAAAGGWNEEASWPCTVVVPDVNPLPRALAAELLSVAGIEAKAYGAYRSGPRQVEVFLVSFWEARRLTYKLDEQRLTLYSRPKVVQNILTGMHARAGYQHDGFLNDAWAFMVDFVCIGFLLWVVTGIIIWWQLLAMRGWGIAALLAGVLSFAAFLLLL